MRRRDEKVSKGDLAFTVCIGKVSCWFNYQYYSITYTVAVVFGGLKRATDDDVMRSCRTVLLMRSIRSAPASPYGRFRGFWKKTVEREVFNHRKLHIITVSI